MNSEDEILYLIEGIIEFKPHDNCLISLTTGEKKTLLAAASSCLHLLLQHQGTLVTKKALFEAGWEKDGLHVTDNTFYQNILTLRRSLSSLGIERNIIITVTRKGLMIPNDVYAKRLTEENPGTDTNVNEVLKTLEKKDLCQEHVTGKANKIGSAAQTWFKFCLFLAILFLTISSVYCIINTTDENNFFADYKLFGKTNGCIIFINNKHDNIEEYQLFTKNNPLNCDSQNYIYLTVVPFLQRVSAIRCKKPLLNEPATQCVSDYYLSRDEKLK
jgi:DNA-binding winged helix-turn-helix (wHTH) protein